MRLRGSTRSTIALLTALVFMLSMVFNLSLVVPAVVAVEDESTIALDVSEPEFILESNEEESVSNHVYDSENSVGDGAQIDPLEEDQELTDDIFDEQVFLRNGISVFGGSEGSALYGADTLLASTLLGGNRSECINDLVIGPEGKVYVAGITSSPDFPKTVGSYAYETVPTPNHVFVAILNSDLSNVEALTTFGPISISDQLKAIALDKDNNVYIAGGASNEDFPTTTGVYMDTRPKQDRPPGFICKLNSDLSNLVASTYFNSPVNDLTVDPEGNVYITGIAQSQILQTGTFPVTYNNTDYAKGQHEVFITKLDSNLSKVEASTLIGCNNKDEGNALTLDSDGNVYVTGFCRNEFPKSEGVYSSWGTGSRDRSFVAKLSNQLEVLASTAIDIIGNAADIILDNEGNIYITGPTPSDSAYILKLSNDLKELRASTSIGTGKPSGQDLVLDSEGNVYVLVGSSSGTIPTTPGAYADQSKGNYELGIAKFDSNLSELIASTYFGGSGNEGSGDAVIALDNNNNIFIASGTMSIDRALKKGDPITPLDFPLTDNAFQKEVPVRYTNVGGGTTGFISKFQAPPNWNTNVYKFTLDEQVEPAVINVQEHSIDITVQNKTDLTSLTPEITLSSGATISPASGQAVDFSTSEDKPVIYTVTAENGTNQQEWKVTVHESGVPVLQQVLITPEGDIKLVFDIAIAELPDGAAGQFALTVNDEPVTIDSIVNTENTRGVLLSLTSKISSGAKINLAYTKAVEEAVQVKSTLGKALESFATSSFLKEPPTLQADTEVKRIGQEVVLTFDNDPAWRNAITAITVNDQEITTQQYSMTDGSITIDASAFNAAGDYNIKVLAAGYGCSEVIQTMQAPQSLEIKVAEVTLKGDLMLVFDKQIVLPEKYGVAGQFAVKVNGSEVAVNSITVGYSGDRITLVLADKVQGGQTVTVGYTSSTTDDSLHIKSAYGEILENFSELKVSNTLPLEELPEAPVLQRAEATSQGDISLTFDKEMADPVGTQGQFTVRADGSDIAVTAISKTNTPEKIKLELETKVSINQKVSISYVKGDHPDKQIKSLDGGIVEDFTTEFGSSSKLTPPALSGDTTNNLAGQSVDITFSDDAAWRAAITDITVDGNSIKGQYTITDGNININAGVFNEARNYSIAVKATGYNSAKLEQRIMQVITQDAVEVDDSHKNLAVTGTTPATTVTVPESISDATINMSGLLNAPSDGKVKTDALPALTIAANTSIGADPVQVEIQPGTTIEGPTGWDGTINVPKVVSEEQVKIEPDSGKKVNKVTAVIEVGAENTMLTFTKAVKLVIPGQAGMDAGFYCNGVFKPITTPCKENNQEWADENLPKGGDGKIDVGNDLVIWTKHFTKFVTYEQTATGGGGNSGGNDGGSGGNGTGGGEGSGTPGSLKVLSFNKVKLSATDTLLQFDFGNGMDRTLDKNLKQIRVYEKTAGNEVKWSNHNYIKQGSGDDAVKLRRLELMFNNLKTGTTYVVELGAGVEANNGGTLGTKQSFEFTTSGSADGSGGGGTGGLTEQTVDKDGAKIDKGYITIDIPAAAFDQKIKVKIEKVAETSKLPMLEKSKLASDVMDIIKDKDGNFNKPVTITITFDKSKVDTNKYDLSIYYLSEKDNKWIPLDNVKVDLATGKVSGETKHFTKFAVIATEKAEAKTEEPVPVGPGKVVNLSDIKGHWAEKTIAELVASGAIGGYPDGTFKPDQGISRAEFATIVVKAFQLPEKKGKVFEDTANHWAQNFIATAAAHGIVSGYSDTTFGPDDPITREQMAVMIAKAAKLAEAQEGKTFADGNKVSDWAKNAVVTASEKNIISGYPDNTFRPQNNATRAEAATVIIKSQKLAS